MDSKSEMERIGASICLLGIFLAFPPTKGYAEPPNTPTNPENLRLSQSPVPTLPPPEALGKEKPRLPERQPGPPPKPPEFVLPPVEPVPEKDRRLSTSFRVFVREIRLTGNTVFSDDELSEVTRAYENRSITTEELQQLRYDLTQHFIYHGYINSGALVPDQQVKDGVVELKIIEGELSSIEITGNDWLRTDYIDKRIARGEGPPLNINELQHRLLLLQQDPLIERINAELRPGLKPGQSQLNVRTTEATPYQIGTEVSNNRAPSIGGITGKIWLSHRNLTGFGDASYFSYGRTEGLDDFNGSYSFPLNAYDTRFKLYYQNSESDVVENPFDDIDIRSRSETFGVSLSHPFYQTPGQNLSMALAFEFRRSKSFLGDEPFAFSEGVPDDGDDKGESKVSVIRFSQDWLDRSQTQVIAARSTFNAGIDAFGSTVNSSGPDGKFFAWLGQFQWIRRLPVLDSQVLFRTDLQLASDPLLPLEKFSVGGMRSVRGYRENQLVRDNGAAASLEWRVPVFRLPIPGLSKSMADGYVQLATFADFGWSENEDLPSPDPRTIGSWGLGFRWDPSYKFHSEFYWGIPFRTIKEGSDHDIQDSGIHFLVSAQFF